MGKQYEIVKLTPLLNTKGELNEPGYCKRNLYLYNRENIKANPYRIKEWDFYQVSDGEHMIQLNFFNISLVSCISAVYLNLKTGEKFEDFTVEPFTKNKNQLNRNGDRPYFFDYKKFGRRVKFTAEDTKRNIYFSGISKKRPFVINLTATKSEDHESITIATPFNKPGHFFYTQKLNCMPTRGTVAVGGKIIEFNEENTFMVLDWGRGVWPHDCYWYWANGSTRLPDGKLFGFELTWGFGDESNATETAIFYDGKCHKISSVKVENDPEIGEKWMEPWHFTSEDGRLDMTMIPYYDNYSDTTIIDGKLSMKGHQVHGLFSGKAILDDGTAIEFKDMYAFCEKIHDLW